MRPKPRLIHVPFRFPLPMPNRVCFEYGRQRVILRYRRGNRPCDGACAIELAPHGIAGGSVSVAGSS